MRVGLKPKGKDGVHGIDESRMCIDPAVMNKILSIIRDHAGRGVCPLNFVHGACAGDYFSTMN